MRDKKIRASVFEESSVFLPFFLFFESVDKFGEEKFIVLKRKEKGEKLYPYYF